MKSGVISSSECRRSSCQSKRLLVVISGDNMLRSRTFSGLSAYKQKGSCCRCYRGGEERLEDGRQKDRSSTCLIRPLTSHPPTTIPQIDILRWGHHKPIRENLLLVNSWSVISLTLILHDSGNRTQTHVAVSGRSPMEGGSTFSLCQSP